MTLTTLTPLITSNYRILSAQLASLALVEFAAEAFLYEIMQTVAERLELYAVYDLVDESKLKQELGLLKADAALAHVEQAASLS